MSWRPNLDSEYVPSFPSEKEHSPSAPLTQPNEVQYDKNLSNKEEFYEREHTVRRDTDKQKDFSISILDIDTTILEHLESRLNISVDDSEQKIKVPIIYASPERWKSIRKDGYIRDKLGQIQSPLITFKRTTIERNDQLITFNKFLSYPVIKKFSEKNRYDTFFVANNQQIPVKEIYNVTMADHVIVTYEFIAWTDYVIHMNKIIEIINFATEDYWGDKKRFRFRTSIQNYSFETDLVNDTDRIVKSTFSMIVYAYLLPEQRENLKSTTQKGFTNRKIIINAELDSNCNKPKQHRIIKDGIEFVSPINGYVGNIVPTYDFTISDKVFNGQYISEDSSTYTLKIPAATLIKFENYYLNPFNLIVDGKLVEKSFITSYEQSGQDFYIIINKQIYTEIINSESKIVIAGKFE